MKEAPTVLSISWLELPLFIDTTLGQIHLNYWHLLALWEALELGVLEPAWSLTLPRVLLAGFGC
jgi:hypothetical protein